MLGRTWPPTPPRRGGGARRYVTGTSHALRHGRHDAAPAPRRPPPPARASPRRALGQSRQPGNARDARFAARHFAARRAGRLRGGARRRRPDPPHAVRLRVRRLCCHRRCHRRRTTRRRLARGARGASRDDDPNVARSWRRRGAARRSASTCSRAGCAPRCRTPSIARSPRRPRGVGGGTVMAGGTPTPTPPSPRLLARCTARGGGRGWRRAVLACAPSPSWARCSQPDGGSGP